MQRASASIPPSATSALPRPGGFTDIANSARKVTYLGIDGGLEVEVGDRLHRHARRGDEVRRRRADGVRQQVAGAANGQEITFITEARRVPPGRRRPRARRGGIAHRRAHRGARPGPIPDRRRTRRRDDGRTPLLREERSGSSSPTPISSVSPPSSVLASEAERGDLDRLDLDLLRLLQHEVEADLRVGVHGRRRRPDLAPTHADRRSDEVHRRGRAAGVAPMGP